VTTVEGKHLSLDKELIGRAIGVEVGGISWMK